VQEIEYLSFTSSPKNDFCMVNFEASLLADYFFLNSCSIAGNVMRLFSRGNLFYLV
jgi:hypothetical protein